MPINSDIPVTIFQGYITRELNDWVVQQGLAVASRRYSEDQYVGLDAMAMSEKLGIWQSDFVLPYRWRKGDRLADGQPRYWPEQ